VGVVWVGDAQRQKVLGLGVKVAGGGVGGFKHYPYAPRDGVLYMILLSEMLLFALDASVELKNSAPPVLAIGVVNNLRNPTTSTPYQPPFPR